MVNLLNYKPAPGHYFFRKSKTQPGMAHSIDYYVNRFKAGLPVTGSRVFYDDDLGFDGSLLDNPESDDLTYSSQLKSAVGDFIDSQHTYAATDEVATDDNSGSDESKVATNDVAADVAADSKQ